MSFVHTGDAPFAWNPLKSFKILTFSLPEKPSYQILRIISTSGSREFYLESRRNLQDPFENLPTLELADGGSESALISYNSREYSATFEPIDGQRGVS